MYKLKQMSSRLNAPTGYWKSHLNKDSKKGEAEPFFPLSVGKYPFKGTFYKGFFTFYSKTLGATPNQESTQKTLGAIPKPSEQPPLPRFMLIWAFFLSKYRFIVLPLIFEKWTFLIKGYKKELFEWSFLTTPK